MPPCPESRWGTAFPQQNSWGNGVPPPLTTGSPPEVDFSPVTSWWRLSLRLTSNEVEPLHRTCTRLHHHIKLAFQQLPRTKWQYYEILNSCTEFPQKNREVFVRATNTKCFAHHRAMHFSAKRGIAIACRLSVRLSVCPSVTLVNCDHIGWNSSKIIPPLVSLGRSLFATLTCRVCSKGNTPKFGPKVTHPLLIWASETFDRKLRPNGYR